jgi:F-type H+-transporting ATPase subunit c
MKKVFWMFATVLVLSAATPAFAQGTGAGGGMATTDWVVITSGFAMAIASAFCGLAQGKATASAVESMARNPGAAAAIRTALILGLALIESLALYTLVIIFAKVKI